MQRQHIVVMCSSCDWQKHDHEKHRVMVFYKFRPSPFLCSSWRLLRENPPWLVELLWIEMNGSWTNVGNWSFLLDCSDLEYSVH